MAISKKQVVLLVGGSRGIGRQVAVDLALNGYAVVVAAKSTSDAYDASKPFPPDPNSPQSTISTVVREIKEAGGDAAEVTVDVRDYESVQRMVAKTIEVGIIFAVCGLVAVDEKITDLCANEDLWSSGRHDLQLGRHLVGFGGEDANEALPVDAACESRRAVRHSASLLATF